MLASLWSDWFSPLYLPGRLRFGGALNQLRLEGHQVIRDAGNGSAGSHDGAIVIFARPKRWRMVRNHCIACSDEEDPYLNQIPMRDASSPHPLLACASAILCYRIATGQVRQLFYYIGTDAFGDSQIMISLVGE